MDDDETVCETLTELLKAEYDCIAAPNGVEGLSYLEKNPGEVDLIITDLMMPVMDGFGMIDCIQSNQVNKNIPILVETAMDKTEDISHAMNMGVDDIIFKPFNPDVLRRRVKNMMEIGDGRKVHNVMEDLIQTEINENIDNLGICPCPICRNDLMTLTLNNVKAKYVSTDKGAIITKAGSLASREERIKLLAEITHYAQLIKGKPRHN